MRAVSSGTWNMKFGVWGIGEGSGGMVQGEFCCKRTNSRGGLFWGFKIGLSFLAQAGPRGWLREVRLLFFSYAKTYTPKLTSLSS